MVGSRYAPAAEKRPLLSLKRRETQSQHVVTNRRGPRTTPVQRLRTAATKKRRSAAIALHIFRCDEKCGLVPFVAPTQATNCHFSSYFD